MDREQSEQELMSIASYLYYYADMNQTDIAERLFISRSTVSRLLKKARSSGVIELKINEPWCRNLSMEDEIKDAFGIDSVRVLQFEDEQMDREARMTMLGKMASYYICTNAQPNTVIGLSWGNTISHVVDSLGSNKNIPFTVVPIMGSMTYPMPNPENTELTRRFSREYGGRYFPLEAPIYAESPEAHAELMCMPGNAEAIELARKADIIMTSVGSVSTRSWENVIGAQRLARLNEIGCVGHIGGHFFNISGQEIDGDYKKLLVGLTLDEIRSNPNVLCIACDPNKAESVYASLVGRMINTLMITYPLAQRLMEVSQMHRLQ